MHEDNNGQRQYFVFGFHGDAPIDRDATLHRQAQSPTPWMKQP
jgi:hypothetical protein